MQHKGTLSPGGAPGPPQLLRRFSSSRVLSSAASVDRLSPLQGVFCSPACLRSTTDPVANDLPRAAQSITAGHRRQRLTTGSSASLARGEADAK
jgi:hypothetical protein